MLIADGFVSPQPDPGGRWEPIFHWNESWRDGYGMLYYILDRDSDKTIKWSRENRKCAEIYWSEVFRLLRSNNKADIATGHSILRDCWGIENVDEMRKTIEFYKD